MRIEVLPKPEYADCEEPRLPKNALSALGLLGTVLALLTMLTAAGVGFLFLFGRTLAAALLATLVWPFIFSPQFTQWVFGSERAEFRKLFLLFLALVIILKLFRPLDMRRPLWQKR
ncbi:MAG: hypothetical protein A3J74_06120 [Elusimicrobia bacterium RIFCSPHIGHO2_02_FULL_57_9]|nr:MAG: hypothetical protein A3J74_06120 [Elusimicrobia bacterium RIFCSPHIGHO2_02_FULL_57_9]